MDSFKIHSFTTKISLKISIIGGIRANPPEWGARGNEAVQLVGEWGWMEKRAVQQPYGYPSLWGISVKG
jgi:hypothetical protein